MKENTNKKFVDWHLAEAAETAKRRFELGDIILDASVASGLQVTEVLERLRRLVEGYEKCQTYYLSAVQMVQVYTKNQRRVLIDCKVPVFVCTILSRSKHDEQRSRYITEIKHGKLKAPWVPILGKRLVKRMDGLDSQHEDSGNNPDNIIVAKPCSDPERNLEMVEDVLKCLRVKFGVDMLKKAFERIVR